MIMSAHTQLIASPFAYLQLTPNAPAQPRSVTTSSVLARRPHQLAFYFRVLLKALSGSKVLNELRSYDTFYDSCVECSDVGSDPSTCVSLLVFTILK